ncbi:Protein of unknown function [Cotesia congregata]|uniref:Uncharacterized protein n=1 Tax=Cotesia congregata TaxID=51543 RepID=A0A8J2HB36_COTCN|nr:Protein of unknown function [Cotesia congregata]
MTLPKKSVIVDLKEIFKSNQNLYKSVPKIWPYRTAEGLSLSIDLNNDDKLSALHLHLDLNNVCSLLHTWMSIYLCQQRSSMFSQLWEGFWSVLYQ